MDSKLDTYPSLPFMHWTHSASIEFTPPAHIYSYDIIVNRPLRGGSQNQNLGN